MAAIPLKIDHVTVAGTSLAQMEAAFAGLGLTPDYGGPHSNGVTHMALLGFNDGSYIEFISTLQPGPSDTAFWGRHIAGNAGPCAWAVQVNNVTAEASRVAALGVKVDGPHYYHRRRPDGALVEWDLAFLGDKSAGATLPFIIKDITPRNWRVRPSASVTGQSALLTGMDTVVLGVHNLPDAAALFRRVYGWAAPHSTPNTDWGAELANFAGTPVTLAAPLETNNNWLHERLYRFDDAPCAYLLGARDFNLACAHFNLLPGESWFGRQVAWFNPEQLNGLRLGIVEPHREPSTPA